MDDVVIRLSDRLPLTHYCILGGPFLSWGEYSFDDAIEKIRKELLPFMDERIKLKITVERVE